MQKLSPHAPEFEMKCYILHDYGTFTPFTEKSFDQFKDLHQLMLLKNFDINLTSLLGGVVNNVLNVKFVSPCDVRSFSL